MTEPRKPSSPDLTVASESGSAPRLKPIAVPAALVVASLAWHFSALHLLSAAAVMALAWPLGSNLKDRWGTRFKRPLSKWPFRLSVAILWPLGAMALLYASSGLPKLATVAEYFTDWPTFVMLWIVGAVTWSAAPARRDPLALRCLVLATVVLFWVFWALEVFFNPRPDEGMFTSPEAFLLAVGSSYVALAIRAFIHPVSRA